MPAYPWFVALHIVAGTAALATFWLAAALRKGSPRHRLAGRVYLAAMVAVIASALPLAVQRLLDGHPVTATFLGYLVVITSAGVWTAWRAVQDKHDAVRYTGPVFVALGLLSIASGLAVLLLGLRVGAPLLVGFSAVGLLAGGDMLLKRLRRDRLAARPRWWLVEHYTGMLGNGVATHIAFLSLGLPRLLPSVDGTTLHYTAWFGPLLAATLAKLWLDRRWKPRARAVAQTSPSLSQPSPVPRL
jgi:uncharacterized membrane protein